MRIIRRARVSPETGANTFLVSAVDVRVGMCMCIYSIAKSLPEEGCKLSGVCERTGAVG